MKTWNRFLRAGVSLLSLLFVVALCSTNASAQSYAVLMPKQTFSTSALPDGWTSSNTYYPQEEYSATWFWNSGGVNGTGGAAMDDIWDYSNESLTTPSVDASGFTADGDSVWVDFDFFWEYNGYDYYDGPYDEFEIDGTYGEALVSGTIADMYTYYNTNDFSFDGTQSSSSDWVHYHILIPVEDRTSSMTTSFYSNPYEHFYGFSDAAITNVTFTAYPPPPVPELSLTPKTMNFGTTTPNAPDTLYATVTNVGALPLCVTGTSFTRASTAYSLVTQPPKGMIPPGGSVQYGIQFLPLSAGVLTDTFVVTTNGADSGTQIISLTGIGAVPAVSYSANTMFRGVDVELTDTSSVQYLYVNSIGGGPLTVNSVSFIGLDARTYFITHMPTGSIAPGGVDSIGVRFVPDLEGQPDAHMVINSTGVNRPWDTVAMYGVGILPHLTIDNGNSYPLPAKVNFDSVKLGSTSCQQVLLTNPGSDTVAIEQNYLESADYDFSITPLTGRDTLIPPGGSQNIQVCFTPIQQGTRLATLRIKTNIPNTETRPQQDTSSFTVNIIGVGVPTGKLAITGPTTNGSALVGKSVCVTDTLWNTGDAPLTVTGVTITGANASDFTPTLNLPIQMAANSSQTFTLCADPSDTGAETALLTATGTSNETSQEATLSLAVYGQLIANTAVVSQPFASESCGPDTEIVLVTNTGNVQDSFQYSIPNNANFSLITPANSPVEPAGGVDTIKVLFTPTTNNPATGTLNIIGSPVLPPISLTATGGAATINGSGTAATAQPTGPMETFNDTLTNTGTCPWTPGVPTLPDNSPFAYVSGGTTPIPAGGTGMLSFTFTPPAIEGTYSAAVAFPGSVGLSIPAANDNVFGTVAESGVQFVVSSAGFSLEQNYPNPFSGTSQCEITLPVACVVHLSVIDVEGQVVQTLLNQHYDAGSFELTLDASGLASGTYYYQMTAGNVTLTRQMVILK